MINTLLLTGINLSLSGVVCYGVFFNFEKDPVNEPLGVNCTGMDNFDPDVAGIGVKSDPLPIGNAS